MSAEGTTGKSRSDRMFSGLDWKWTFDLPYPSLANMCSNFFCLVAFPGGGPLPIFLKMLQPETEHEAQ
jgi:hypothetical protein